MTEQRRFLVLFLGGSQFPRLQLPSNPAFENSATILERYFRNQRHGPGSYTVESLFDSDLEVADQADHIRSILAEHADATDLIVYYVGHGGFLRNRSQEYFLALRSTRRPGEEMTGLRPETLSNIINERFIDRRVFVILDCCFAGEAIREFQADGLGKLAEKGILQRGTALLVASSKDAPAISPIGRPHTMFCECLMDVLTTGIKGADRHLSLEAVTDRLRDVLTQRFHDHAVLPEIHSPRQPLGSVAKEPLFANPAYARPRLPKEIHTLLKSDLPRARAVGVELLEGMLNDEDDEAAALGRRNLEHLAANDDSKMVARLAVEALERRGDEVRPGETGRSDIGSTDSQRQGDEPETSEPRSSPSTEPDAAIIRAPAELRVTLKPNRTRVKPNSSVTWKCTITNPSEIRIGSITVTDGEGTQLVEPFGLGPGGEQELAFQRRYGAKGRRMTVLVRGRVDGGDVVAAEGSGRVRVTHPVASPAPSSRPAQPMVTPGPRQDFETPSLTSVPHTPLLQFPEARGRAAPTATIPSPSINPTRFRAAVRKVKATTEVGDTGLNEMLRLVDEGERHYRILVGDLARPANWQKTAEAWVRDAAVVRNEDVVMVKLTPPSAADIMNDLGRLAKQIELASGVPIPLDEFS